MKPDFRRAVETVLEHEGGFVDDPADAGGATNWGISLRFLRELEDADGDGFLDGDVDRDGDVDAEDIRRMPRALAIELYRRRFWIPGGYDRLSTHSIAEKIFDLAVNMGPVPAHRIAQQAVRAASRRRDGFPQVDGRLGPASILAIDAVEPFAMLAGIRAEAAGFYRVLVAKKNTREGFLAGWLNRAYF